MLAHFHLSSGYLRDIFGIKAGYFSSKKIGNYIRVDTDLNDNFRLFRHQIKKPDNYFSRKVNFFLHMCIFVLRGHPTLEATPTPCSPYSSSERTCNNELTLFVRVAVVLPLPTKPRALREPYLLAIICKKTVYTLS